MDLSQGSLSCVHFPSARWQVICQGITGKNGTFHTEQVGVLFAVPKQAPECFLMPKHPFERSVKNMGPKWLVVSIRRRPGRPI